MKGFALLEILLALLVVIALAYYQLKQMEPKPKSEVKAGEVAISEVANKKDAERAVNEALEALKKSEAAAEALQEKLGGE